MRWLAPHSLALVWVLCGVAAAHAGSEPSTVFVARRGWHIDIGMAVEDLQPPLNQAAAVLPGCRYVFFGFADKHYLLAKNHHAPVLLSALFPGAGIVLTTGLPILAHSRRLAQSFLRRPVPGQRLFPDNAQIFGA